MIRGTKNNPPYFYPACNSLTYVRCKATCQQPPRVPGKTCKPRTWGRLLARALPATASPTVKNSKIKQFFKRGGREVRHKYRTS